MKIKVKRGPEERRKTLTPESGELIYITDTNKLYIGDGQTKGGIPLRPFSTYEWSFSTVAEQTEYSPAENEESLHDPSDGLYIIFYGATKLSKSDYSIDAPNNQLVLNITPPEDGIEITICYVGL